MGKTLNINGLKDKYLRSKSKVVDWKISTWKETGLSYLQLPDGHPVEGKKDAQKAKSSNKIIIITVITIEQDHNILSTIHTRLSDSYLSLLKEAFLLILLICIFQRAISSFKDKPYRWTKFALLVSMLTFVLRDKLFLVTHWLQQNNFYRRSIISFSGN